MTLRISMLGSVVLAALSAACSGESSSATAYPESVSFGENGGIVVFTPAGISLHDGALERTERTIALDAHVGGTLRDEPIGFALADDGLVAAVAYSNTEHRDVAILDLRNREERRVFDLDTGDAPVQGVALDPSGARVFVRGQPSGMFDTQTGDLLWDLAEGSSGLESPVFSRSGDVVYGFRGSLLEARWALTGDVLFSVETGSAPGSGKALARSGLEGVLVGTRLRAAAPGGAEGAQAEYVFWSEQDGSVVRVVPLFPGRVSMVSPGRGGGLACSAVTGVCASSVGIPRPLEVDPRLPDPVLPLPEARVALWTSDGTLLQELPTSAAGLSFSPDGSRLAVASTDAQLYRVADGVLLGTASYTYGSY